MANRISQKIEEANEEDENESPEKSFESDFGLVENSSFLQGPKKQALLVFQPPHDNDPFFQRIEQSSENDVNAPRKEKSSENGPVLQPIEK